ncbi:MAG TPA: TerC/Alx family metal homeostasis membrane protein, partial [Solirubrobacterales bacterium]|nr:TerC/Alx family metal homeostasis membrane protein [Solirubrobacterales bacterium]
VIVVASFGDLKLFGRNGEPTFREAAWWSVGWFMLAMLAAVVIWVERGADDAVLYTTVYLIERSLSLDNVFVFLLLFTYFQVPPQHRPRLIILGIIFALVMRGLAILGGIELLERFDFLIYVLAAGLLILAVRIGRGMEEGIDVEHNLMIRAVRRVFPVDTGETDGRWFTRTGGSLHTTPIFLCFVGLIFTDIVFAIDSIPAAFAITRDSFIIWTANVFALLGLRALIILVDRLIERFQYLDQTIAVVLGVIAIKLALEQADLIHISPLASLGVVAAIFAAGITASILAEDDEDGGDSASPGSAAPAERQ